MDIRMRIYFIPVLVVLAIAALLSGNCLSCPQLLLAGERPAHDCCPGPKPAPVRCSTQDLQHAVVAAKAATVVPVPAAILEPPAPVVLPSQWSAAPPRSEHAPPDPLRLSTSLRI
jgi:hypothetical protein